MKRRLTILGIALWLCVQHLYYFTMPAEYLLGIPFISPNPNHRSVGHALDGEIPWRGYVADPFTLVIKYPPFLSR